MPIGSFDAAWENYTHDNGPALVDEMKSLVTAGPTDHPAQPNWRLTLGLGSGAEDFTKRMETAEVTFSKEGESGIRLEVAANLRQLQYERAPVSFWFGYGNKLVPYFRGRLASPVDSPNGIYGQATAYGLKTEMGQRYFAQRVDYGDTDLRAAVADIIDRFGADPTRFDFRGTHSTTLAKDIGEFGLEVSLQEALDTVLEPMQFLAYENPGGVVVIDRSHLASLGTDNVFSGAGHYDVEHYPMNGFTFDESMANFYSDVVIFRRNENYPSGGGTGVEGAGPASSTGSNLDEYVVYVDKDTAGDGGVTASGPFNVQEGRYYIIPDYPGQQEHAERERELLRTALNRGVGHFEHQLLPVDIGIGDHYSVSRIEQQHDPSAFGNRGIYAQPQLDNVNYACVAEETTLTVVARSDSSTFYGVGPERWAMTVSGQAFEMQRTTARGSSSIPISTIVPVVFN